MDINLKPVADSVQVGLNSAIREPDQARFSLLLSLIRTNHYSSITQSTNDIPTTSSSSELYEQANYATWHPGMNESLNRTDMASFHLLKSFTKSDKVGAIIASINTAPQAGNGQFLDIINESLMIDA